MKSNILITVLTERTTSLATLGKDATSPNLLTVYAESLLVMQ